MDILDLVFPRKCLECGKEERYVCSDCLLKVKKVKPICPYCERSSIDGVTHFACKRKLGIDGLTCLWEYSGVVRKAILAFKYKYATEIVKELCSCMVRELQNREFYKLVPNDYCLVPVPLHWYRQNFRGFNQSEEIGKSVVRKMGWKFIPDLLIRKKSTSPQAGLKAEDRIKNIQGVFSLNTSYQLRDTGKTIVLLDDVWTTGSTVKEAAKVLKRAGVKEVWGLTIAR